jgi:hypothetical protein
MKSLMETAKMEQPVLSPLEQALGDAQAAAREQLSAAWQLQTERVEEQLNAGWRDQVGRIFEERFAELSARLAQEFDRLVAGRAAVVAGDLARAERRTAFAQVSQSVRRLSQAQASGEWAAALLDAAVPYCRRCLLFSVGLRAVIAEGARGFDEATAAGWSGREIQLQFAPAFATAIESRDVVVALRSPGEISQELAALVGESEHDRAHVYPVLTRGRCAALLFVEPSDDDCTHSALELLAVAAGLAFGARSPAATSTSLVPLTPGPPPPGASVEWAALSQADQELHLRAQRFARVQAAEMRLYQATHVRVGRARQNLYEALREPIDTAREAYHRQFVLSCPSMQDYLHQELVRTLANGDASMLGPSYPGPLA